MQRDSLQGRIQDFGKGGGGGGSAQLLSTKCEPSARMHATFFFSLSVVLGVFL